MCKKPAAPASSARADVPVLVRAGVDDDVLARIALVDLARRVDAVADRHADVHQDDVGGELRDQPHGFVAVPGAPDDDEAAVGVEDLLHERRELLVVLADDDAQWCLGHRRGACHSRP